MQHLIYTPTVYELSERAYEVAKAQNLIHAVATCGVTTGSDGVKHTYFSLQALFRKPGAETDAYETADFVTVNGDLSNEEEVFERFAEKVQQLQRAYYQTAA